MVINEILIIILEHNWDFSRKTEEDTVRSFWEILEEFEPKEREKLLFFVTSLKRPPVGVSYFLYNK